MVETETPEGIRILEPLSCPDRDASGSMLGSTAIHGQPDDDIVTVFVDRENTDGAPAEPPRRHGVSPECLLPGRVSPPSEADRRPGGFAAAPGIFDRLGSL